MDRIERAEFQEVISRELARQRNAKACGAETVRNEEFDKALEEVRHRALRRRAEQSTDKLQ